MYNDFNNDNQKELLLITLNKLLLEKYLNYAFEYHIGSQIVDIVNIEIVELKV